MLQLLSHCLKTSDLSHPEKSVIVPQQRLAFLGFIIDFILMTVSLTQDKITKIKTLLSSLLENSFCSFRPDPEASLINACTISWVNKKLHCYPLFRCISQAVCVVVVPNWPTQAWYPLLTLVSSPFFKSSFTSPRIYWDYKQHQQLNTPFTRTCLFLFVYCPATTQVQEWDLLNVKLKLSSLPPRAWEQLLSNSPT